MDFAFNSTAHSMNLLSSWSFSTTFKERRHKNICVNNRPDQWFFPVKRRTALYRSTPYAAKTRSPKPVCLSHSPKVASHIHLPIDKITCVPWTNSSLPEIL
jgi:transposase-like protein